MTEEIIMLVMEAIPKGIYEKLNNGYRFESEKGNYILTVTDNFIEFKIKTIKWIPGSYEPIEGSELYKVVLYEELKELSESDKLSLVTGIINELQKK